MNWGLINFLGACACALLGWRATFWALASAGGAMKARKDGDEDAMIWCFLASFGSRAAALVVAGWGGVLMMRAFS